MLLPLVIGVVYLGGWWLFALALGGGLIALHELYAMAKELRPLVLAGYVGFVLALLGVELGGLEWLLGGVLLTFFLAFVLYGLSDIRDLGDGDLRGHAPRRRLGRGRPRAPAARARHRGRTASGR